MQSHESRLTSDENGTMYWIKKEITPNNVHSHLCICFFYVQVSHFLFHAKFLYTFNRSYCTRPLHLTRRDCGGSSDGGFAMAATGFGPAIRTAAKRGTTAAGASIARACRRQVKRRLAETPFRRATSETFAPGTSVSSTSRIFSSDDHRRRRSTPSRTSTRICRP